MIAKRKPNSKIDEAIEESFPASDPPSFMGGEVLGAPKGRKSTVKNRKMVKTRKASAAKNVKKKKVATKRRKAR